MLRIVPYLLLLSVVQPQIFRPDARLRPVPFMRPPQKANVSPFRFQAAPSNIDTVIRAPPEPESFISGATPFLQRPRPSVGDLAISNVPSFELVPPPSAEERNDEVVEFKQGSLHPNEIEEPRETPDAKPESPIDESYDEEGPAIEDVRAEENAGTGEEPQSGEPKPFSDFKEGQDEPPSESFTGFNPFSFDEEEVASPNEDEGKNKKREANPQEGGVNFNFPNFPQATNQFPFNSFNGQDHREESQQRVEPPRENQFSPPIYRPDQNPNLRSPEGAASRPPPQNLNGFNPPSFGQGENPTSFGFSEQGLSSDDQQGHKSEFNFNQQINHLNRPSPQERPSLPVRNERPSFPERQERPSLPVRNERPSFPDRQERPPLNIRLERPSQPERQERPSPPERQERPVHNIRHERPSQSERQQRPSHPERQERPSQHERPSHPERQERPSHSERPSRPERQERPLRPNVLENSLFQTPAHRSEGQERQQFQFPSFSEAQINAQPYIPTSAAIQTPPQVTGQQQLKKGVLKRKPFKKRQEPQYQATGIEPNQLFQGYQEEDEEEVPDRLSTLLLETSFNCVKRKNGYYADEELSCEVFHFCQDGVKHSWLCPNGGSFHQVHLICLPRSEDNICEKSSKFHFVNDYLYQLAGEGKNKSYVQRYYPDGYTEGIAALEERHSISEQAPPPPKQQYRVPQQPPKKLYQFNQQQEHPRQVQLGPPLRNVRRPQYAELEDYQDRNQQQEQQYEESNDYPVEEEIHPRSSPNFRSFPNFEPGRPTSSIASLMANQ